MDQTQNTGMPTMQSASGSGKKVGIIIAIVLIVLAGGYFLLRDKNSTTPAEGIVAGDQNSITVGDQDADSVAVLVSNASLRTAGFIVIHENNGGVPGATIGISNLLQPGSHTNISIVANKLIPGSTYIAMLHGDDGNGIFNETNDISLKDNAGNAVMAEFRVKLTTDGESKG